MLDYYRGMGEIQELFLMYRKLAAVAMHERDWATAERALADAHALASKLGDAKLEYDEGPPRAGPR
jgi:hypothetical protein